jgi:hypothetical protein
LANRASYDPDAAVRGAAVKRLTRSLLLKDIAQQDADAEVREAARERLEALESGLVDENPPEPASGDDDSDDANAKQPRGAAQGARPAAKAERAKAKPDGKAPAARRSRRRRRRRRPPRDQER